MKSIKVLVIDSNKKYIDNLKKYFSDCSCIKINLEAYDGISGLKLIKENQDDYDVVLIDLILPNKDGIDVIEEMNNLLIDKKIIVITSCNSIKMIRRVSELGIDYFLLKPFDNNSLKKKIISCYNKDDSIDVVHNDIRLSVTGILHELGVPSNLKGYNFIREGIILVYSNSNYIGSITNELYPFLARRFNTTVSCIERAIRHAIEVSWNRGNWDLMEDLFGHSVDVDKAKPTNSEYIVTIADKLKLDYFKDKY